MRWGLETYDEDVETSKCEEEECRNKCKVIDVVRKHSGTNKTLEEADGTEPEVRAQHGEELVEELIWPANLGEHENDDLEDYHEAVDNRPEDACRLVRHGTSPEHTSVRCS